jgi:alkanesulfonate monooxygenase SsuD/methylene tetrahydromethanopterin reductase-like flavin-dependent oxidoreductase (luciferase family)
VFGKPELYAPVVEIYRARWAAIGRDPAGLRVGTCSHVHVAATDQAARARWEPFYRQYWAFTGTLLGGNDAWPPFDYDTLLAGPAICGSPAAVVERIGQWRELLGIDRHLFMFDLGGIDEPMLRSTIELFGTEVLPQL